MSDLTIVMYHYVRPVADSEFPGIKGLELYDFSYQLDFLLENYNIVSTEQVIDAYVKGSKLPKNACWLTFDDGYKDHYLYVLPELLKRGISGAFFSPRVAIETDKMLDVNSIHHILSCTNDISGIKTKLNNLCGLHGISDSKLASFYDEYGVRGRFDSADIIYVKRMLQHILPEDVRNSITSKLFHDYVGVSESEFSSKLYMNLDETKELVKSGMYVGSHGSMHYWLGKIDHEMQLRDIKESLTFLERVNAPTSNWVMCYPYGSYNSDTVSILRKYGASLAIGGEPRVANILLDGQYDLPRLDANDFPKMKNVGEVSAFSTATA